MGQVNLVLIGQHYIRPKGSFTVESGSLTHEPVANSVAVSPINGAINSFVRAAAQELENGIRINAVSSGVVEDSPGYCPFFPGDIPVPMDRLASGYVKSILGIGTVQVIEVRG